MCLIASLELNKKMIIIIAVCSANLTYDLPYPLLGPVRHVHVGLGALGGDDAPGAALPARVDVDVEDLVLPGEVRLQLPPLREAARTLQQVTRVHVGDGLVGFKGLQVGEPFLALLTREAHSFL